MRLSVLLGALTVVLFVLLLSGAIFGACGPTYRYAYGSDYSGGFFFWGTPGHAWSSAGSTRGRTLGGRFRGGGTGFGK